MNGVLRQSTSQVRTIGPFVDDADFKTLKSALTIANTDIKLKKNGVASANKNSGGATADGTNGLYQVTWDATDTATVGELSVSVKVAGALVWFSNYTVLSAAAYDAIYANGAIGYVADQVVILSAAYDKAKTASAPGDAMTLTSAYDPAKTAMQAGPVILTVAYDAAKTAASPTQVKAQTDQALVDVGLTSAVTGRIDATVSSRAMEASVASRASQSSVDIANGTLNSIIVIDNKLNTALEQDGAVFRFTANALEMAPVGEGTLPPVADSDNACAENPARTVGPTTEPSPFSRTLGKKVRYRV